MIFHSLLAASVLATSTTAFLVPLEVAKAVKGIEDTLHLSLSNQKSQAISLECPGCFFDTPDDRQDDYAIRPENELFLNFTIDDSDNTVAMNGQKFYPMPPFEVPYPLDLYAPLVRLANGKQSSPIHLGFALEYMPSADTPEGSVMSIRFTILNIGGIQVKVPTVVLDLIIFPSQELLIAKLATIPYQEMPGSHCQSAFCRVTAIMSSRIREMIDAARARAHQAGKKMGIGGCDRKFGGHKAMPAPGFPNRLPGHRRPPHAHHHNHNHNHAHHHSFAKFFHRATHLFVIPALLGIIGGLTASAIGMLVGQIIVFLWFRFVRGGHRGRASSARDEVAEDEEKEALVIVEEADEMPPPVYEESDGVIVIEDKQ